MLKSESSIFNTEPTQQRLWIKRRTIKQPDKTSENPFDLTGLTLQQESEELTPRQFILQDDQLCYKRGKGGQWGCFDLKWTQASFKPTEEKYLLKFSKYTLNLIKNKKITKIFLKGRNEKKIWRNALKKICIMKDFHKKYKSAGILGKGSYARVIRVVDKKSRKKFAVKIFSKSKVIETKKVESLKKEIEISQKLNHRNIVKFEECHETKNSVYLIFEYLEGPPIFRKLIPLDLKINDIRKIMFSLLNGLKYLKEQNIVHRDIKPYNILFKENGNYSSLKILDFGLSCERYNSNEANRICGTPGYMAPEMFDSKSGCEILDSSLDVYSAGVIFHYLLFEKSLFQEDEDSSVDYLNNKEGVKFEPEFDDLRDEVRSADAFDLMKKMLSDDYESRIQVVEALNHPFFSKSGIEFDDLFEREIPQERIVKAFKLREFGCKDHKKLFSVANKNIKKIKESREREKKTRDAIVCEFES